MALKKKTAKKGKPVKTAKVKKTTKAAKTPKVKGAKTTKTAKVTKGKKVGKAILNVADRAIETYTGSSVSGFVSEVRGKKSGGGIRRRRGTVPKTVRKWIGKISRRRKQEEKQIRKLIGSDGGKVIRRPRKAKFGYSPGVVTKSEFMEAMRR